MSSFTHCPTLDDYRKTFATMESKGIKFDPERSVPLTSQTNYIKQEFLYFWRISETEFELNNESDELDI